MSKTKELIRIINENPERELIFMYPNDGSDHQFTQGYPSLIVLDDYWVDGERFWFRHDDEGEISDYYGEIIADGLFEKFPLTDNEEKILDDKVNEFLKELAWKKAIIVYVAP